MSARPSGRREHGPAFWAAAAVGWLVIGFGVWSAVRRAGATRPPELVAWVVGLALAHDLLVAPLVAAIALLVGPRLPSRFRGPVIVGAIVSGALVAVSLPPLLGARPADNPSLLPRDYGVGLAVALGVVWAGVLVTVLLGRRRRARVLHEAGRDRTDAA